MKSHLLGLTLIVPTLLSAQITINQSDMPSAGDTLRYSVAANAIAISAGAGGSGQTWDFSNLQSASQYVDDFIPVAQTPFTYIAVFGLPFSSNYCEMARIDNSAFQIPEIPVINITIEDVYNFYKSNNDAFEQRGFGASINGFPLPISYSDGDVLVPLPLNASTTQSGSYSFNATIPTIGYYGRDAERNNEVDGSGTLVTPFGTFETIRLRSELVYTDSVALDALGFGFQLPELTEIKYKWMAVGYGWPLLEITANSIFGAETVSRVVYRDNPIEIDDTGIEAINSISQALVFPNPANEFVQVRFESDSQFQANMEVMDMMGKILYSKTTQVFPGTNLQVIPAQSINLSSGCYFIRVHTQGEKGLVLPFLVDNQ
ncbi:MAG: T9SS type A sorting domain-containing protein [Bacteroidia bacterium]